MEAEEEDEEFMILQLNLVNAFNVCDRDSALQVVEEEFPDILKWVLTCYGSVSILVFGDTIIRSECGFHQGDPLASRRPSPFTLSLNRSTMMFLG